MAENGAGTTSLTLVPPTGYQTGDVIVAIVAVRGASNTISTPVGWTLLKSQTSTTDLVSSVFYRVAASGESNAVFNFGISGKAAGAAVAYSGVDTVNPIDINGSQANTSSTTYTASSIVTTAANARLVGLYSAAVGTAMTAGSSMTKQAEATSSGGGGGGTKIAIGVQDITQAAAGATGTKTMSGTAAINIGHLVALKPAPVFSQSGYRIFTNANSTGSSEVFTKLANPATLPAFSGYANAWSLDGAYLSVGHDLSPFMSLYRRAGDTFTKLANPATLPAAAGVGVDWSPDGTYMIIAHGTTPFVTIYKRAGDTFTKLANPATLPAGTGYDVAWSPDGTYMSVAHGTTPFVTIYKRAGDTFTKLANPATLPPGTANGVAWSLDGTYMSVVSNTTPFVTIYKRAGDTFTKLANPATIPPDLASDVTWSPDGTYMAVSHFTTPFITIYKRSGDTFTKLADPTTLPTSNSNDIAWSPDGVYLSVTHDTTPFVTIYKRAGDTFTKLADPATLPLGGGNNATWSPDRSIFSVVHNSSPYITNYKFAPPTAQVSTPLAAANTPTTSGGRGVPFRLRMNLHVTEGTAGAGHRLKLQYATRVGTCDTSYTGENYYDVTTSTNIMYYNNSNINDMDGLATDANDPTHGSDTLIRQSYEEGNSFSVANGIGIGQDGMWDFSLVFHIAAPYGSYCMRVVKEDGTAIGTPSQVPEVSNPTPTAAQANYRWFANANSVTPGSPLAAQDTAASIAVDTPFRLRQRIAVDVSLMMPAEQSFRLQYAEKVGTCDTAFTGESYQNVAFPTTQSSQTAYPTSATTVDSGAPVIIPWVNANNVFALDSASATITVPAASQGAPDMLQSSGYSFSIPLDATVTGIVVQTLGGYASPTFGSNSINLNGFSFDEGPSNTYGGPNTTWGMSLTPSDINGNVQFSPRWSVNLDFFTSSASAGVDAMPITVYYTVTTPNNAPTPYDNATPADGAAITSTANDPTNGARPTVYMKYSETALFTGTTSIAAGSDGMWDIMLTAPAATSGKTYCFRTVKNNGSPLDSYAQIPEITFSSGTSAPTTEQKLRGGQSLLNGLKSPFGQ